MIMFSRLIQWCVLLPIFAVAMASGSGYLGADAANGVRGAIHLAFLAVLLLFFLLGKQDRIGVNYLPAAIVNAFFFVALLILFWLSIHFNQAGGPTIVVKYGIFAVFAFNLLILYPHVLTRIGDLPGFYRSLERAFVALTLGLLAAAGYYYLTGKTPYFRLGYPLRPGVFAVYMLIAGIIAWINRWHVLHLCFLGGILLAGSRSALAIWFLAVGYLSLNRQRFVRLLALVLLVLLLFLLSQPFTGFDWEAALDQALSQNEGLKRFRAYLVKREDVSSGRLEIWQLAIDMMGNERVFWWGLGDRQVVAVSRDKELTTHNSFFDLSLSHGVPFAVVAYLVWFVFFRPRLGRDDGEEADPLQVKRQLLFVVITAKSLITTTFWTNMADPATFFCLLLLSSYAK
jgi:hypothetical protein